jgi:hypothetical protein
MTVRGALCPAAVLRADWASATAGSATPRAAHLLGPPAIHCRPIWAHARRVVLGTEAATFARSCSISIPQCLKGGCENGLGQDANIWPRFTQLRFRLSRCQRCRPLPVPLAWMPLG